MAFTVVFDKESEESKREQRRSRREQEKVEKERKERLSVIQHKMDAAERRRKSQTRKELAAISRKVAPGGKPAVAPSRYHRQSQQSKKPITDEVEYFMRREAELKPDEEKEESRLDPALALPLATSTPNNSMLARTSGNNYLIISISCFPFNN